MDIDIDLCPSKRPAILRRIKNERGKNFKSEIDELSRKNLGCTLIATFGTEGTKSAILTACRGYRSEDFPDGIDSDTAQYMSSLIPSERGFLWDINDVLYGNAEKDRKPVAAFINEVNKYEGLLDIIKRTNKVINKRSTHASGVILFEDDPYEHCAFMKAPNGDLETQFDLHMCEAMGLVKYDFLVTEIQDKILECLKLLQEDNKIDSSLTIRQVYEKYLHPDVLDINNEEVWNKIQQNNIVNLFQFDSVEGSQAIKKIKPQKMLELADANSLMRLMTSEKGAENPIDKYVRFKNNHPYLWKQEMKKYSLTEDEQRFVTPYFESCYGVPSSQESVMQMLMDENICHFTLKEANTARKIIGKKKMSEIPKLKEKVMTQALSSNLGRYVWDCGIGPQLGYSFSLIHSLAYSYIGYQTAYLATQYNPIYWDTACLIVNSQSLDTDEEYDYDYDEEDVDDIIIEARKKEKGTDYVKTTKALNKNINAGIAVSLLDINKSQAGFKPDAENNQILFGLKALSGVNNEVIDKIIAGRPYKSIIDFMNRCPIKKPAMISLIKGGAFDNLVKEWAAAANIEPRYLAMGIYLLKKSDLKTKLNLQNFNGLISNNLIPEQFNKEIRIYNFNKCLKAQCKFKEYYIFNNSCTEFYNQFFDPDRLTVIDGFTAIEQKTWDKIYTSAMLPVKQWIKDNQQELLNKYNNLILKESWDKNAEGNLSAWEMSAICFYYHDHELKNVDKDRYGLSSFSNLPETPEVDYYFKRGGRDIPIFKLTRLVGTILAKEDKKSLIVLLTPEGDVINVKFSKEYYANYARQLSEVQPNGKKKVIEKGWFKRGTKVLITGFRREDTFVAKTYKNTASHQLYLIEKIQENGTLSLRHDRLLNS